MTVPTAFANSLSATTAPTVRVAPTVTPSVRQLRPILQAFADSLQTEFAVVDVDAGEVVSAPGELFLFDCHARMGLLAEVAARGRVEIVEDESPLCVLAIPFSGAIASNHLVAVATFVTSPVDSLDKIAAAARVFGLDAERAHRWAQSRMAWNRSVLVRLGETTLEVQRQKRQLENLGTGMNEALAHARDTYIELGLLHRLARRLHVADTEEDLWGHALKWLSDAIPAQSLAIVAQGEDGVTKAHAHGELPLDEGDLHRFIADIPPELARRSFTLNRTDTRVPHWKFPTVREVAVVPVACGSAVRAWLMAVNHRGGAELGEFGSVELRLLDSVAAILAIHSSNTQLFQKQGRLFLSSVAALASAIDAKDRYTSGHSDRVARLSLRLAEHLGLGKDDLDAIYLGGLLHDIGKIGVDEAILNKPGQLTEEEFEQIKKHPQLGYDILKGVAQFEKILPIVLYHHEAWNGRGYPHGLVGEASPLLARIVAVADSFDAMTSNRAYRQGMPLDKVEGILREQSGKQWDSRIIDAYFAVRDDFQRIANGDAEQPGGRNLDPRSWIV